MTITVPNGTNPPLVIEIRDGSSFELATRALAALAKEFPEGTVR